jgi:regulator of replication initiation timing
MSDQPQEWTPRWFQHQCMSDAEKIERLKQQLAAEQEKNKQADIELDRLDRERSQLRQELAAERVNTEAVRKFWKDAYDSCYFILKETQRQLLRRPGKG